MPEIEGAYSLYGVERLGRKEIFTDVHEITPKNIIPVLQQALAIHQENRESIQFLLDYEKGIQPLKRKKVVRKEIDVNVIDNIANQITEFKLGYNWGQPITLVQRGDRDLTANNPDSDDDGISLLNQMNEGVYLFSKDQELGRFVEICGIGYQIIDINTDYQEGDSAFTLETLDPRVTFIVKRNDLHKTKLMSVTYRTLQNGDRYFTCITKDSRYEIANVTSNAPNDIKGNTWKAYGRAGIQGEKNPMGMVPVVEYIRAYDRMGAWERQIPDMDSLNIEVSDFCNACAESVQGLIWGNDFELPVDESGNPRKPVSGQWVMTKTAANGKSPIIRPIVSNFDYGGVQTNIQYKRNTILQKCYVPLQSDPGGGSTATAMSMSSGWSATEAVAAKQEDIIRGCRMELVALELQAIKVSGHFPKNHVLMNLRLSDIQPKFTRQKTFDLGTKANAFATLINTGVDPRTAMVVVDLFPDVSQAIADSHEMIELHQTNLFTRLLRQPRTDGARRIMSDTSDQSFSSPFINGSDVGVKEDGA